MGKIKLTTLGSENEQELREKRKVKLEEKKKREQAGKSKEKVHVAGMKGGQRVKAVGTDEEEINRLAKLAEEVEKDQAEGIKTDTEDKPKKKKKIKVRSKRYQQALTKIDHNKEYSIKDGIALLRDITLAKFDSSVELHINTVEKGLRGTVGLPHGTGKKVRVVIADEKTVDKIVEDVGKGIISFDALISVPQVVGKLAKVARYLGPKGLMPNPKNGTITNDPQKVADKMQKGEINWKTEADFPLIHQVIGKLSFKDSQLEENFKALTKSIGEGKIRKITLKSTMSPGIKVKP